MIATKRIYFRVEGKTIAEEYGYATASAGEFDIPIPGTGSVTDWLEAPDPVAEDSVKAFLLPAKSVCSPDTIELKQAWSVRKHHPEYIANIAQAVAHCEQGIENYDFEPTEYEFAEIAGDMSDAPELKKYLPFRIGQLEQLAEENGIAIPALIAWAWGPTALWKAFAPGLIGQTIAQSIASMAQADRDKIAGLLGAELIALAQISPVGSGILWIIGRIHGEWWNDFLEAELVLYDLQVDQQVAAGTYAPKKTAVPITTVIKTPGGQTVYRITPPTGGPLGTRKTEAAPPLKASGIHKKYVDDTKEQHGRQTEVVKIDAREFHASMVRAGEIHLTNAVKAAIEWFIPCDSPGELYRKEISKAAIEIKCGDVGSFDLLNTPEVAAKLHAELAEQMGIAPPPPTEEKGSPIPWIMAVGGYLLGGVLGAGAGFAIGKSMEVGNASKTTQGDI
jgi:hypothetical protein